MVSKRDPKRFLVDSLVTTVIVSSIYPKETQNHQNVVLKPFQNRDPKKHPKMIPKVTKQVTKVKTKNAISFDEDSRNVPSRRLEKISLVLS